MDQTQNNAAEQNGATRVEEEYDRVITRYYREWLLYQVTKWDETHRPELGYLIAHSPSRAAISEALRKEPPRSKDPDAPYRPYYIFFARPELRRGETLEEGRARFRQLRAEALDEAHD
jgi:hypothetical protein